MNKYKVVHVKKGVMEVKARTSYEAAKIFAAKKRLKTTAGVDAYLMADGEPTGIRFL